MKQQRKVKANYRSVTGYVSYKGKPIAYESTLERDFLIYQTFRKDVVDIVPQPIVIPFVKNGRKYTYTPDFFVQPSEDSLEKPLLVEVKYKEDWQKNWREWSDKWKTAMVYCKQNGFRFAIYDESRIRHKALANINFLKSFQNLAVSQALRDSILCELQVLGSTTLAVLIDKIALQQIDHNQAQRILWSLMSNKLIGFDVWSDIRNEVTEVWYESE